MRKLNIIFSTLIILVSSSMALVYANNDIKISNAWVRMMPPSESTSAGFLTIENNTDQDLVLQSVTSEAVEVVEMHQMIRANGMMKMGMVHDLVVPAKGKFVFDEERYHLMLINVKQQLKLGESIPIVLHFKGGQEISLNAIVQEAKD